ncbi:MAG: RNA-binding protein [Crenarchaeota archaeon]|nr:RNA-binding protein [Thermoproteota archaeon]
MFNLVVSTGRRKEGVCIQELRYVCDILGVELSNTWFTGFDGLVTAKVEADPIDFCRKLKDLVTSQYYVPRFILKVVPILEVVVTDLEKIKEKAVELAHKLIGENETYRIDVRKRGVQYSRIEIIDMIAKEVKRKVRLENPDKILHIDIFPSRTGISVFREDDVFSLLKLTLS